jgi:hypothetical protein
VDGCAAGSGADTVNFSVSGTITLSSALPSIQSTVRVIAISTGEKCALTICAHPRRNSQMKATHLEAFGNNGFYAVDGPLFPINRLLATASHRFQPGNALVCRRVG